MNKVSQTLIINLLRKWTTSVNAPSDVSKIAQNIANTIPITTHNVYKTSLSNPSKISQTKRTFLFGRKKPVDESLKYDWEWRFHHWIGFAAFFSVGALQAWSERAEKMKKKRHEKRRSLLDEKVVQHHVVKEVFSRLPLRIMSKVFGFLTSCHIPQWARVPLYSGYSAIYGCNLQEIAEPLDSFENFRAFFTRELKEGARPIDLSDIVSPVDARVLNFGQVHSDTLEQVKGIDYSLFAFFGKKYEDLERLVIAGDVTQPPTKLFHCIFYLAPGDYHQFHSPADWTVQLRRHFPGYLFPVAPISTNYVQGLFSLNERVVLFGKWKHGFFSYTPVGATNVGSILINFDKDLQTNQLPRPREEFFDLPFRNEHSQGISVKKGDPIGCFQTGSTIVLIFEAPANFDFTIQPGQAIKLGQSLGTYNEAPTQES